MMYVMKLIQKQFCSKEAFKNDYLLGMMSYVDETEEIGLSQTVIINSEIIKNLEHFIEP
jgi:hypothetical protein